MRKWSNGVGALLLGLCGSATLNAASSGAISGQFGVDRVGAATYEIPIQLAPGTAGVAPEFSFNYNSHSPDGMLGVGWSVTGLSSITRCEIRRGGQNYPVSYTATDRFCLDGDYLVAEPGQVYGADGSRYRLEKQPWVRVQAFGQCPASGNAGPCRFVAEQPSGDRFEFGATTDSAIEAVPASSAAAQFPLGAMRVWAASRYINKSNNAIEFRYRESAQTGEYVPSVVLYTSNALAATPLLAQRAVAFTYEQVPLVERYQGGARIAQSNLLRQVVSCINPAGLADCNLNQAGTQQVARYAIEYAISPASGRELVQTITQFGSDDTARRPQRMHYQAPSSNAFAAATGWSSDFTWDDGWNQPDIQERQLADINGDGRYDLIGFGLSSTEYALSTGTSFARAQKQPIFSADQGYNNNARFPRLIVDVNGDGLSDILGFGNTKVQVALSTGSNYAAPTTWSTQMTYGNGGWDNTKTIRSAADINGDGRSDIIGFGNSTMVFQLSQGDTFGPAQTLTGVFTTSAGYSTPETHPRFLADINGDGRADIVGFKSAGVVEIALSTGNGFGPVTRWTDRFVADSNDGWVPGRNPRFVSDLNNDGLADLIGFRNDDVVVAFSTGRSFSDPQPWTQAFTYNHGGWDDTKGTLRTLGDVDGDRLPDIIGFGNNDTSFGINRLSRFDTSSFAPIKDTFGYSSIARNPRFPADSVGSGISALIGLGDTEVLVALPPSPTPDLLVGVVNEIGGTVDLSYASIVADSTVYTPGGEEWTYPYRSKIGPMDVVAEHTIGDGLGGRYVYQHRYQGTVAQVVDFGFLGFEATTLIDLSMNPDSARPGVATRTSYAIEFPQSGLTTSTQSSVVETGKLAGRYDYAYQTVEVLPGIYDVRKISEQSTQYALNSERSYQTRQTYAYDDYGNLQLLRDEGNVADAADDSAVCVNYTNLTNPWRIGFPRDSATARSCTVTAGNCACSDPITRDRWEYTDAALTYTRAHAQYDSSNQGWLGEVMEWDDYGNQIVDQGAYWVGDASQPTLFNPLNSTFDPDYRSYPIRQANPLFATTYTYDARFGVTTSQTDPNGVTLRYTYDGFARLLTGSGPSPQGQEVVLKRWTYAPLTAGAQTTLVELRDWNGATATSVEVVDGLQRLIRSSNEVDADCVIATAQAYLAVDRVRQQSLPYYAAQAGHACARAQTPVYTTQVYDALGRLSETVNPDGTITHFDLDIAPLNNVQRDLVTQTDAYGTPEARRFATYLDSSQNPLRWVFPPSAAGAANPLADLEYDALGRLVKLTAPKGEYSNWVLDSLDRVTALTSANSGTQTVRYAREGMQSLQTDADGRTVAWTYDPIGRVQTETVEAADGAQQTTTFSYDQSGHAYGIGRLTSVAAPAQQTEHAYDYDPYGNRQQSQLSIDGRRFAIQVDYDPMQRAVQLTYPDNARQRKRYSADGFLAEVSVCLTGGSCADSDYLPYATYGDYTAMGGPQTLQYRGGRTSNAAFEYDTLGRVRNYQMQSGSGTALIHREFDWNRLNELLASTDKLDELRSLVYAYDGAGYLSAATIGTRRTDFGYDELGNLKQKGEVSFESVAAQVRRGTRNGQEVFAADYDASGNMTRRMHVDASGARSEWRQTFDALGRMTSIQQSADGTDEAVASFVYDYNQSLLKRIDLKSGVTSYYVSQNFDVAVLEDGSSVYTKYVDGLSGPVAAISTRSDQIVARIPDAPADRWVALAPAPEPGSDWLGGALASSGVLSLFGLMWSGARRIGYARVRRGLALAGRLCGHMLIAVAVLVLQTPSQVWAAGLTPGANGPGIPVAGNTLFFYNDQVRSSVLVVDPEGNPQTEILYAPYGEIDESTSFGVDNFRAKFAGVELAEHVGLYLNNGRYFDPLIGRFVGADINIIGASSNNAVMLNRYAYAANNPITNIDPNGGSALSILFDIGIAAFAIGAVLTGGGVVAVAELGAYFGGAAVNHSYDPSDWNYKSWKTYGGMAAGIAVSEVGLAISIAAPEAIPEEAGAIATFLAGVAADAAVGFAENATYAALGGADRDEILKQGLIGAATGAAFSVVGQGISAGVGRLSSRAVGGAAEAGEESSQLGSRSASALDSDEPSFGGACVFSSFAAGTMVATPDGAVAIEELPLHGTVLALNEDTGRAEPRQVSAVFERTAPGSVEIVTANGEHLVTTPEHPFLLASGWTEAGALKAGDRARGPDGAEIAIERVEHKSWPLTVHNIEVQDLHTYLVGSEKLAVHNPKCKTTSQNSKELRKNMVNDGEKEPDFANAAHHIVESTDPSKYMQKARDHLDKIGIDINDSVNGVFLARSSRVQSGISKNSKWAKAYPHSRLHTTDYKRTVWRTIKTTKTKAQVRKELRTLAKKILTGQLPEANIRWP